MLTQKKITVKLKDLAKNYSDLSNEYGPVIGYDRRLNIRPSFQREFVYDDKKRNAVIDSILGGYDIGKFTWGTNRSGGYEVIDGQQRTISICQFFANGYSVSYGDRAVFYSNLNEETKERFDNYEIDVVVCDGSNDEKLKWFQTVNIAGEELTKQELRNAAYPSHWLECAKRYFSKPRCAVEVNFAKYFKPSDSAIRQDYLEKVLTWYGKLTNRTIEEIMSENTNNTDEAREIILYFKDVFDWVTHLFPVYRKEMRGVKWGLLYNQYHEKYFDPNDVEKAIGLLMSDEDITSRSGIYEYVLSGDESLLSVRAFNDTQKRQKYEEQKGICPLCGEHFAISDMHADHIVPWSRGGRTVSENLQMLCTTCNIKKSNKMI